MSLSKSSFPSSTAAITLQCAGQKDVHVTAVVQSDGLTDQQFEETCNRLKNVKEALWHPIYVEHEFTGGRLALLVAPVDHEDPLIQIARQTDCILISSPEIQSTVQNLLDRVGLCFDNSNKSMFCCA
jgi:hypothetical protein